MTNKSDGSTTALKAVCAAIFLLFTTLYIYAFQGDLLAMTQHSWAHGMTHYDHTIGTVVITLTLSLLSLIIYQSVSLPSRAHALVFFPSFLLMGLLTSVVQRGTTVTITGKALLLTIILLLLYIVVVVQVRHYAPFLTPLRSTGLLSHPWWTNLSLLIAMMLMVYGMGNTDRTLHTRLAVERHVQQRQWEAAIHEGYPQYDNDSSLTMLRALALANVGQLGERIFNYEPTGGSRSLLPRPDRSVAFLTDGDKVLWRTLGPVPRNRDENTADYLRRELRRGTLKPAGADYLLVAYLLDRDIKSFMEALPKYYTINDSLPAHYKEAYMIYCDNHNIPDTLLSRAVSADYADYLAIMRSRMTAARRDSALRSAYYGTYWYYYSNRK